MNSPVARGGPGERSGLRFLAGILTTLLLSLPVPALGRTDLLWLENLRGFVSPIDSANSSVHLWSIHRDDGSAIGAGEGVVAAQAFLGRDWDRGMGFISVSALAPLETPWIIETLWFDWYVPNADSAARLTVEWSPMYPPDSGPGSESWQSLCSAEYQPGSGVHREVIDFTSVSTERFLNFSLRFVPSGGNGEAGLAVRDLGVGFAVFGQAPEPATPSRVMAAGLMLWLVLKARARWRRSDTSESELLERRVYTRV